jgi:hypothetical protein
MLRLTLNSATCVLTACYIMSLAGHQNTNTAEWSALCPNVQRKILDHLSLRELAQLAPLRKELHAAARDSMLTCRDRLVSTAQHAWGPHIIRRMAHVMAHPFYSPEVGEGGLRGDGGLEASETDASTGNGGLRVLVDGHPGNTPLRTWKDGRTEVTPPTRGWRDESTWVHVYPPKAREGCFVVLSNLASCIGCASFSRDPLRTGAVLSVVQPIKPIVLGLLLSAASQVHSPKAEGNVVRLELVKDLFQDSGDSVPPSPRDRRLSEEPENGEGTPTEPDGYAQRVDDVVAGCVQVGEMLGCHDISACAYGHIRLVLQLIEG